MGTNANQSLPSGTILHGKAYTYTIGKLLGQGAFGITYLASTRMTGPLGDVEVQVALKEFFAKELDSRMEDGTVSARTEDGIAHRYARAFQRESENLSKMKHPGIVNVLEAFEANGTCYYSMEFLSGGSLDDKVKGRGIPEQEALPLIRKIGDALAFMHDQKVMHLDLKPKNIMLKADGSPVIIDFGLSKQYDSSGEPESSSSIGLGTPGYAPLEQSNQTSGRLFQPTLDIYALGATLYKMLTGTTPPPASEILNEGFPDEILRKNAVSVTTINAIRKAMSPTRKNRTGSVKAFLLSLEEGAPEIYDNLEGINDAEGQRKTAGAETEAGWNEETSIKRGPSSPERQKSDARPAGDRYPVFTIIYLSLGLLIGVFVVKELIYGCIQSYDDDFPERCFPCALAAVGALAMEVGIILLLFKKRPGFWSFVAGGVFASITFSIAHANLPRFGDWNAFLLEAAFILGLVLVVAVATFFVLRIKNREGKSAWDILGGPILNKQSK